MVESAVATVQSIRKSFREEKADKGAEQAPRHTPSKVRRESIDDKLLGREAGEGVVLPTKADEPDARDKREEPTKPTMGPDCLKICNIQ